MQRPMLIMSVTHKSMVRGSGPIFHNTHQCHHREETDPSAWANKLPILPARKQIPISNDRNVKRGAAERQAAGLENSAVGRPCPRDVRCARRPRRRRAATKSEAAMADRGDVAQRGPGWHGPARQQAEWGGGRRIGSQEAAGDRWPLRPSEFQPFVMETPSITQFMTIL
jgi:hypothetical protein